jgi:hypothetical protein
LPVAVLLNRPNFATVGTPKSCKWRVRSQRWKNVHQFHFNAARKASWWNWRYFIHAEINSGRLLRSVILERSPLTRVINGPDSWHCRGWQFGKVALRATSDEGDALLGFILSLSFW